MLSRFALRTVSVIGLGSSVVHQKYQFEKPILLILLPLAIIKHAMLPILPPEQFQCPNRKKLHDTCTNAKEFDKMTVPPVNLALEEQKIPLTKESLKAIKGDIRHTQQMKTDDPLHKKVKDYQQQSENQRKIAISFRNSGEKEGEFFHDVLSLGFSIKAQVANIRQLFSEVTKP